mmetsp:Transcript_42756/g.118051  ORF Transcript_42756/g.118051 Transcript_42756/m.118051 type:complete len:263 (-) Transcript_42756:386-1174(-)
MDAMIRLTVSFCARRRSASDSSSRHAGVGALLRRAPKYKRWLATRGSERLMLRRRGLRRCTGETDRKFNGESDIIRDIEDDRVGDLESSRGSCGENLPDHKLGDDAFANDSVFCFCLPLFWLCREATSEVWEFASEPTSSGPVLRSCSMAARRRPCTCTFCIQCSGFSCRSQAIETLAWDDTARTFDFPWYWFCFDPTKEAVRLNSLAHPSLGPSSLSCCMDAQRHALKCGYCIQELHPSCSSQSSGMQVGPACGPTSMATG